MSQEEINNPDNSLDATPEQQAQAATETTSETSAEQQLEQIQAKADEYWNELLRARADLENMRRRHSRDLESAHKHALDKFVTELLPVCDSLELGLNAAGNDEASLASVREGMDMTLKMLIAAIAKFGLEQINPEGESFDPEVHQAMAMQPVEGQQANQVIAVMQKGYRFNGRLLRPAMVVVSQ